MTQLPPDEEVAREIDEIERYMRNRRDDYNKSEFMQQRLRDLYTAREQAQQTKGK